MRRLGCLVVFICLVCAVPLGAQETPRAAFGDPPLNPLITVSAPNADGIVTINGSAGSVYPNAFLTLRNLYTYDTAFAVAGITGIFQARISATPNTPILISPQQQPPPTDPRDISVAVPGGPAAIVYVPFATDTDQAAPVTPLSIDGSLDDWRALEGQRPTVVDGLSVWSLRNTQSLYLGIAGLPADYASLVVDLLEGELRYSFRLERRANGSLSQQAQFSGTLIRNPRSVTIAASAGDDGLELRLPQQIDAVNLAAEESVVLDGLRLLDSSGITRAEYDFSLPFEARSERDGLYRPDAAFDDTPVSFTVGGALSGGAAVWSAVGRASSLSLDHDRELRVELDVTFNADVPLDASLSAQLWLTPVAVQFGEDTDAPAQPVVDRFTNNGWSNIMTPSGLAVDNLAASIPVESISVPASVILRRDNRASFPLTFRFTPPQDLPAGLYTARLQGYLTRAGETLLWEEAPLIIGRPERENAPPQPYTRLPVVFNRGDVLRATLPSALFMEEGADGARGALSDEDRAHFALSDRIRYPGDVLVLPRTDRDDNPIPYSLEPYLLNALPNISTSIGAPLIPFDLPGGEIAVRVRREGVSVANFRAPIAQVRISTSAPDDRQRFGSATPVDLLRLTTIDPRLTAYEFPQDGSYTIEMSFTVRDVWGNRYEGGGVYRVRIARTADIVPAVLPGTPFELGDTFDMGLRIQPAMPADVQVRLRVFPLDGDAILQHELSGRANPRGIFTPDADTEHFTFAVPGEYLVEYDVQWQAEDGSLWSAVLRSAGVIASGSERIVAHGRRGMANAPDATPRPAWFFAQRYADVIGIRMPPRPYFPYFSGDIVWMGSGEDDLLRPIMTVQDVSGEYAAWLEAVSRDREYSLLDVRGELPISMLSAVTPLPALFPQDIADTYSYLSISRPGVSVRQTVLGGDEGGLSLAYSGSDRLGQQIGAGAAGAQPGDFAFLFGGAVIRTPALSDPAVPAIRDTAVYASLLIHENDSSAARTLPPGRDPILFNLNGQPVSAFFHPTGTRPGDVLTLGETFTLTGQAAPTLPMTIEALITAPDGTTRTIRGTANAIGYFSDPSQHFVVDQVGVWRVSIRLRYDGVTSTGENTVALQGGVLGEQNGAYNIYVVPEAHEPLPWNPLLTDVTIPAAVNYNFSFTVPDGWTNAQAFRTLTTPALILEDGDIRISGRSLTYTYSPANLINRFTQIENIARASGESASDARTLTIVITGIDENGERQIRSRTFTIWHDRLIALES